MTLPILTTSYRILRLSTSFYRFLPIMGPLSDCRTENGRITIGKLWDEVLD